MSAVYINSGEGECGIDFIKSLVHSFKRGLQDVVFIDFSVTERSNRISQGVFFDIASKEVAFLFTKFLGIFDLLVSIVWEALREDYSCGDYRTKETASTTFIYAGVQGGWVL